MSLTLNIAVPFYLQQLVQFINLIILVIGQHVKGLEVAASSYHKVLEENRFLYNQVQDLRGDFLRISSHAHGSRTCSSVINIMGTFFTGTIRVYCRVRPFLSGQANGQSTVDYIGDNGSIMIVNPLKQGKDARRVFQFNKVYGANVTQGK